MPGTEVELDFTAAPGKYPSHKGGKVWLHETGGVRSVKHGDRMTTKVFKRVVLETGDKVKVSKARAKTLMTRYPECFADEKAKAKIAAKAEAEAGPVKTEAKASVSTKTGDA